MVTTISNTSGNKLSDKFDTKNVSSLSLVLFEQLYILFSHNQNKQILAVHWEKKKTLKSTVKALISNSAFKNYLPLSVFYHGKNFALIPGVIHEPAYNDTFLYFGSEYSKDNTCYHVGLESNSLQLIGDIPNDVYTQLAEGKQEVKFQHAAASFLSLTLKEKFNLLNQEILICIYSDFFYLAAFKDQELLLFNRFDAPDEQEVLHYIYGIASKLSFDPKLFRLSVFESEFNKLPEGWGNDYFRNIKFPKPISNQFYQVEAEEFKNMGLFESFWLFN